MALFALTLASIGGLLTHGNTTASAASVAVDNNGHVIVRKVKSANAPAADGTLFSGTVSSPATPWGGIAIGQQTAPITVNFGTVTVTESAPANGWAALSAITCSRAIRQLARRMMRATRRTPTARSNTPSRHRARRWSAS